MKAEQWENRLRINVSPLIYRSDYDTYSTMSDVASRIMLDMKFDAKCRKQELARDGNAYGR